MKIQQYRLCEFLSFFHLPIAAASIALGFVDSPNCFFSRNTGQFFLLLGILILGLYSLQALRGDAIRLVLDPLQRMLKIVLQCKSLLFKENMGFVFFCLLT